MTSVYVCFTYGMPVPESAMRAIDNIREVYGIRRIVFNETEHTVSVEYDATRLNADTVAALLRRTGLEITGTMALA